MTGQRRLTTVNVANDHQVDVVVRGLDASGRVLHLRVGLVQRCVVDHYLRFLLLELLLPFLFFGLLHFIFELSILLSLVLDLSRYLYLNIRFSLFLTCL